MDGAEAVFADIDATPAVVTMTEALSPGAPQIHADAPGNVAVDYHYGDSAAVAAAFARASYDHNPLGSWKSAPGRAP